MLNKTRILGSMDISRLGAAIARPGIDTRVWVSLAVALGESHVDPDYGVFVDVQLLPSGEKYTARVSSEYAGNGFGFYAKIHEKDDLIVSSPSGNPANGLVVSGRFWSAQDKPPQQAIDDADEVMLIVEKGKKLRLTVSGDGVAILEGPKVRLGSEDADENLILGKTFRQNQKTMDTDLYSDLLSAASFLNAAGTDTALVGLASLAAAALVNAGASLQLAANAVNTFETSAGSDDYLSQVTNTK